jgi:2-C-methyl-D-erythritol 2,4-cyclodiphosphate synthase
MLRLAYEKVVEAGYRLVNLDCVVRAEAPKLSPHKEAIRAQIAQILKVAPSAIGLKAKTGEGMGTVGRGEVIEATAVVLVSTAS